MNNEKIINEKNCDHKRLINCNFKIRFIPLLSSLSVGSNIISNLSSPSTAQGKY